MNSNILLSSLCIITTLNILHRWYKLNKSIQTIKPKLKLNKETTKKITNDENHNSKSKVNFFEITDEWISLAKQNANKQVSIYEPKVGDNFRYKKQNYLIDGKHVKIDHDLDEREFAEFLMNEFKEDVRLVPRVLDPPRISCPDYIFKKERWDLKSPKNFGDQTFYRQIERKDGQARNFIIDIVKHDVCYQEMMRQVNYIYNRKDLSFLDEVMIVTKHGYYVFKRI